VQYCTVFNRDKDQTLHVDILPLAVDNVLAELRRQGLTVRLHSGLNNTWHIADGGLYSGYVASSDELLELQSANKLNICGIKSLG
jgi:hypothetical protein